MCGLGGFVSFGKYFAAYDSVFKQLLYMNAMRGNDSTGIALINPNDVLVYKKALSAADFIDTKGMQRATISMHANTVAMGHCRSATRGSIKNENAHPFEVGDIIGMHNGSILNHQALDSGVTSDVDSHHIVGAISNKGAEDTLPKLNGAAVVVWWDEVRGTFNIARTKERNVYWGEDEHGTLWYASEWPMLYCALERNGVKMKDKFTYANENTWYEWNMTGYSNMNIKPFKAFSYPNYGNSSGGTNGPFARREGWTNGGRDRETRTTKTISGLSSSLYEPTSKKVIKKINDKLSVFGLKVGDQIPVRSYAFTPYRLTDRNSQGIMLCTIPGKKVMGKMHETSKEEYLYSQEMGKAKTEYKAEVINAGKDDDGQKFIVLKQVGTKPNETLANMRLGPGGLLIPKGEYTYLTKDGCCLCNGPIKDEDHEDIGWSENTARATHEPVCLSCNEVINAGQEAK